MLFRVRVSRAHDEPGRVNTEKQSTGSGSQVAQFTSSWLTQRRSALAQNWTKRAAVMLSARQLRLSDVAMMGSLLVNCGQHVPKFEWWMKPMPFGLSLVLS